MTRLRVETYEIEGTEVGPVNPLPPLEGISELHNVTFISDDIPPDMAANIGYGRVDDILPYLFQDGYDRDRHRMALRVAVLENDYVRAVFLLDFGGRLWSLIDRGSGQELLYVNPVLQPANFALRNAWFSGGVEWNISTIGHAPLGCEPIHAARVVGPNGDDVLRMYDWERMRGTPFQIDAHLPADSRMLFIHVRILNPQDHQVPIYWWSNAAVPEREDVRVLVPAHHAFRFSYDESLTRVSVPYPADVDISYATRGITSNDYFFDVREGHRRPWIAAVDGAGAGLVQVSTPLLRGRKLYIWGMSPAGRRWQEFLSIPGHPYLEIQAGLARSQFEHVPLAPHAAFSWLEAYGRVAIDPGAAHGPWDDALGAVEAELERRLPGSALDDELASLRAVADAPPAERLHAGTGWGALERRRRAAADEPVAGPPGLPFEDDTLGPHQAPWLSLLEEGSMHDGDPEVAPSAYLVDDAWRALLERDPRTWEDWLHLGVMRYHAKERAAARDAWQRSLAAAPNAWALRDLAVMDRLDGDLDAAAARWLEADRLAPGVRALAMEVIRVLTEAGRPDEALAYIDGLAPSVRAHGRIKVLETTAALDAGDLDRAWRILDDGIVLPDLREGGVILEDLWYAYQSRRLAADEGVAVDAVIEARARELHPVPPRYDYRKPT